MVPINYYCWFSVSAFKIDWNTNQKHSIDYVQNLGKERRSICKAPHHDSGHSNFSSARYAKICEEIAILAAHPDGLQHSGRKPAGTSIIEFSYKSVNLSLEEFKNIKIILFSNT